MLQTMKKIHFVLALFLMAAPAFAEESAKPVRTVVRAKQMLDVKTGELKLNAVIVIEGGRIHYRA